MGHVTEQPTTGDSAPSALAALAARVVDQAPPLTPAQAAAIAALLRIPAR